MNLFNKKYLTVIGALIVILCVLGYLQIPKDWGWWLGGGLFGGGVCLLNLLYKRNG